MINVRAEDGSGSNKLLGIDSRNAAKVAIQEPDLLPIQTPSRYRFFSQLVSSVGDGTGVTDMKVAASDTLTDGVCSDHAGPTFTFTSVSATLLNAQQITITDAGDSAHGILGVYQIVSVNSSSSVELDRDPTDGTNDVGINFTIGPAYFTINSHKDYDIRIMKILIYIEDTTVSHVTFGALTALTNGIDISVIENGTETYLVQAGKKFADLIQQTVCERPFGDAAAAFELISVTGTADAQILPMDIGALVPGGIRLGRGTLDKFQVEVNDELQALDHFTVRVIGYRHYP